MLVLPVSGLSERGRKRERARTGRRSPQASSAPSCDSAGCRTRRPAPMGVPSPRSGGVDQRSTTAATRYARPCLAWLCPCSEERLAVRRREAPWSAAKPKAQVSTCTENESRLGRIAAMLRCLMTKRWSNDLCAHCRRSGCHAQSVGGCLSRSRARLRPTKSGRSARGSDAPTCLARPPPGPQAEPP